MKRPITTYRACDPSAMAYSMSDAAKFYAFQDMRADILELYEENARLRNIMRIIAYPKRGTYEEGYELMGIAKLIQLAYTDEQLAEE